MISLNTLTSEFTFSPLGPRTNIFIHEIKSNRWSTARTWRTCTDVLLYWFLSESSLSNNILWCKGKQESLSFSRFYVIPIVIFDLISNNQCSQTSNWIVRHAVTYLNSYVKQMNKGRLNLIKMFVFMIIILSFSFALDRHEYTYVCYIIWSDKYTSRFRA
jgi:hypothetical protein